MICYVGAAQNEKQAQNALKKYNKWTAPDPANPTTEVVWDGAVAMIAGCKLITGYQNSTNPISGGAIRMPVYHSLYWMNVLWPTPDDTLYNDVANVAHAPIIEFDFTLIGNKPSNFVRRSANLPAALVPIDTKILGITPVWGGSPNMGWLYDSAA